METYILHLETATKVCSVALSKQGTLIGLEELEEEGYSHGENLTLLIEKVLKSADINVNRLNAICVTSGPGSYTGLRIGAATAKGLCFALDIPLISVNSLISLAYIAKESYTDINLCPVIDARRMEVYNLISDSSLQTIKEVSADIIDEESYDQYTPFVCFGDGSEKLRDIWKDKNCTFDTSIVSSAKGQVVSAFEKFNNQEFEDLAYWEPYYLKDFIAGNKK